MSALTCLRRHSAQAATSLFAVVALACTSEPISPPAAPESASLRVTAFSVGPTISTIVVEVSAADIATPLVFNLALDAGTGVASGVVRVPHGDDRLFSLTAFNASGAITHDGQTLMDVRPGQNSPLQVQLRARSGQVPIDVSFGAFSVIVGPSSAVIDLATAPTTQLQAQLLDVDGQEILSPDIQWATDAPAVATVDASGQVTGHLAGSATIVATYEGVAGMNAITVIGGGSGTIDLDNDGFTSDVDCNDEDSEIRPGASEQFDGLDNDCDGFVDENFRAVITEVMADGAALLDVSGGEWIEIHNAGAEELNVSAWFLGVVGPDRCQLPGAAPIPPGGYAVIGPNADPATNGGLAGVIPCAGVPLPNGGAFSIYLAVPLADLETIDMVSFDSQITGTSWSLDPSFTSAAANDGPANWCPATTAFGLGDLGTPGGANPSCP